MAGITQADSFSLKNKIRFITATSLFDGHDAAIHIMRRILQSEGAEVIHLGHNRSVEELVNAAIQEDVHSIAVSSYQGGHVEYFSFMLKLLKEKGASHIKVFGGGGGVITPAEIELLHQIGVCHIFTPEDGQKMGLVGMIRSMLKMSDYSHDPIKKRPKKLLPQDTLKIARLLTMVELGKLDHLSSGDVPVIGITGPGGAGKSSLVDEILVRFLELYPQKNVAVLSVDPTRRRTGGALLGDRIRMNSSSNTRVFVRSMATRRANLATSSSVTEALKVLQNAHFDLIILETAGIGQSDSEVCDITDFSVYAMTPEFGAPSQLEKIDMLDYADIVVINKFDRSGALDALRDVRKTYQRNRKMFARDVSTMPVYGTCAHRFNDGGINTFSNYLFNSLVGEFGKEWEFEELPEGEPNTSQLIPQQRSHYLNHIVAEVKNYHLETQSHIENVSKAYSLYTVLQDLGSSVPDPGKKYPSSALVDKAADEGVLVLRQRYNATLLSLDAETLQIIHDYHSKKKAYEGDFSTYEVRGKEISVENHRESLSGLRIPKVCLPDTDRWDEQVKFIRLENVPGDFPFTAGVFPFKHQGEDPTRMFAGEGHAEQTNRRFHFVSKGQLSARLSTAFDSVTLYGADPDKRPDIYGKIGNAGVSVCTLDDAKRLYSGFDLCARSTSVSMTINGPAPTILAFFFNAAIDAACERKLKEEGRWQATDKAIQSWFKKKKLNRPIYRDELPDGHDGVGLGFLGISAGDVMDQAEYNSVKAKVLSILRGTVQADILKEDQAQNTCIFSTEFAMRMMGDVQQYFTDNDVRNFYSVSISGYHIAEAGATPVTQLAFTLANGFTILEYYLSRGMKIDDFAHNLSFFFSNGMDPEYSVIGRVARRIWAIALKELYGANERSQKMKYHIQTSGRSLHSQELAFNDIRTTLQALYAIMDNCNSLHTNAYDEAVTTPTEESVRRAIAIQMIINHECGLTMNENPVQGSYFISRLTDMVEDAVLKEFVSLDARGGVLGAMETMYQRSKIQEESMIYEGKKHTGEHKIVGVNFWVNPELEEDRQDMELRRSSDECKDSQVEQVAFIKDKYDGAEALQRLKIVAKSGGNVFEELMEASKKCTLGSITGALFDVGGAYRRNM